MSVSDGQPVNAATTNPAFISKNTSDQMANQLDFTNPASSAGPSVIDIQKNTNAISSFLGSVINSVYNILPTWATSNRGSSGNNIFQRVSAIDTAFDPSSGHKHTGATGDAPQISALSLSNINLTGFGVQGTDLSGVTGTSTVVTSQFTGQTPSTSSSVAGIVVNAPYNKIIIRNSTNDQEYDDALGNTVYGRLTYASTVWTLSYYSEIAGTETAYTFASSGVRFYYQALAPIIGTSTPIYSDLFFVPSSNATADVVDATASQSGKVNTTTQTFGGQKTFNGGVIAKTFFGMGYETNSQTGSDVVISFGNPIVALSGNITNIGGLLGSGSSYTGAYVLLLNAGTYTYTITDNDGSIGSGAKIRTGTGANVTMPPNASLSLMFSITTGDWHIVGGVATTFTNPMTAAADMITGAAGGVPQRVAGGTSNQMLFVNPGTGLPNFGTAPIAGGGTGVTSVTTSPTASSFAGWDANKNLSANNLVDGYQTTATGAGTTTLTVGSGGQQFFTGTTTQTVVMPVVSTLGLGYSYLFTNNSTGAVTVNSSGGNLIITLSSGQSAIITCILITGTTAASWNATAITQASSSSSPSGMMAPYAGSSAPSGWLLCDGTSYSTTTYAALFAAIGYTFGGSGSSFNVPDCRNVFLRGVNSSTRTIGGISYPVVALGATVNDKMQGHVHNSPDSYNGGSSTGVTFNSSSNPSGRNVFNNDGYSNDGTNGTPRTGTETAPINLGVNYIIKQ